MERLSEPARLVLDTAQDEVHHLDHPYIGTEHLLLGLLSVDSPARDALLAAGATADRTRAKVVEAVGRRDPRQRGEPELSARARRAVERAARLSLQRRDSEIKPEHLLFGILDVEGRAGQVLRGLGVDVAALESGAKERLASAPTAVPASVPPIGVTARPHCPHCGSEVEQAGLAYHVVGADGDPGGHRQVVVVSCAACGAVLGVSEVSARP